MAQEQPTLTSNEALARIVWSTHILSVCSSEHKKYDESTPWSQKPLIEPVTRTSEDNRDADNEAWHGSKEKLLDCLAESISYKKGWHMVTVTALRETAREVVIDVVTNGGFQPSDTVYFRAVERFMNDIAAGADQCQTLGSETSGPRVLLEGRPQDSFHYTLFLRQIPRVKHYCQELHREICLIHEWKAFVTSVDQQTREFLEHLTDRPAELNPNRLVESGQEQASPATDTPELVDYFQKAVDFAFRLGRDAEQVEALNQALPQRSRLKVLRLCRYLARPLTTANMLETVSRRLPEGKTVTLQRHDPPAPVRLKDNLAVPIGKAWEKLKLPLDAERRVEVMQHNNDFRQGCSQTLGIHTEVQLLVAYIQPGRPWPGLRFDYFGCSKKACLLCHALVAISPLRIRMRGTHGKCYPNWGIPPEVISTLKTHGTPKEFENLLLERIKGLLQSDRGDFILQGINPDSTLLSSLAY